MNFRFLSLTRQILLLGGALLSFNQAHAQTTVTSGGWFVRGTGTNFSECSVVLPLSAQRGVTSTPSIASSLTGLGLPAIYHLNATNTHSQYVLTNRLPVPNAVAAFGSKYGGSPLYYSNDYDFGVYAGDFSVGYSQAVVVTLINRTTGAYAGAYAYSNAIPSVTNDWNGYVENGLTETWTNVPGLTTIIYDDWGVNWGITNNGDMILTHIASPAASNYEYTVWVVGTVGTNWMILDAATNGAWSPLYTMTFDAQPPLQPNFVSQPQFSGTLLPPFYQGKSLAELLATNTVVTNVVSSAATNYTDLDNSPELRDHPTLDQFVTDMGSNALALTSYVFNQIELCDAVAYNSNTNDLLDTSLNLGGINRSAYATFMEGEGSPTEQCALLVYLLRRAGVPACYIFGPTNGIQMLDSQLSSLLKMQIHGIVNQGDGQVYTTNTLISVNYPWVAAYINGQWIHLFPWLKNTEVTEGLNLFDYLPAGYNTDASWISHYLAADTNIYGLSAETDVPSTLFPLFVQQCLLTNAPGVSLDDIGTTVVNRQVEYNQWSDFPTPFAVTNGAVNTVHDLTSITNISGYANWTNIFDTVSVKVFSTTHTNKSLFTGNLRMADLQDRKFLIRQQTNGANFTLTLSLAPYRPALTNVMHFTNDAALLNQETLTLTLTNGDNPINVIITSKRQRTEPGAVTNESRWASFGGIQDYLQVSNAFSIHLGDLAAICLHSGRVSQQMLTPWAQEYWTMQQEVKANPSITNTLSADITQGTLPYLMGMSYYERLSRSSQQLAYLHKVQLGTVIAQGLSLLGAQRNSGGNLIKPLNLYHPHVDMHYTVVSVFGNGSLQPDIATDNYAVLDGFLRLLITEGSAQEHKITEDFYSQTGGISSVRLLLEAQQAGGPGVAFLTADNYNSFSNSLAHLDTSIWNSVVQAFTSPPNPIANVYITGGLITNTTVGYSGMGALIYAPNSYSGIISGNGEPANGGWGEPLSDPIYSPPDYNDIDLSYNTSSDNNWSVTYSTPTISAPASLAETVSIWTEPTTASDLASGAITYGGADVAQQNAFDVASFSLGYTGAGAAASAYTDAVNNGGDYDPHVGPEFAQLASGVADPVNAVTGEFYIDATDLSLPGPMPLLVHRNYSSQDVDLGDTPFGYGWRPAYTPYLRIVTNLIYAAEMDGTVVAYRQPVAGTNFWQPLPADNPQLNNSSGQGVGSLANLFNNYITTNVSGQTNFVLTGADGSVRLFQYGAFPIAGTTNTFNRYRPYLQTWTDSKGNSYSFTYQTNNTQPDYGQLLRVQSSNGGFLNFNYDASAHITQAYTGDGRTLTYDYDSHGDLVTVTLPDQSQINYTYEHSTVVTNGATNIVSSHLISQEQKPDGRTLANTYDSLRRVATQAATVGSDLNLVTNAIFTYSNTFTNLTNTVITGSTAIVDVFGHTNTYAYTSNQITSITDQLGQTIIQVWFTNSGDTGYYPHSLKSRTDKRGLNTAFQYDSFGNLAQMVQTGNLTGGTANNETATNTFTYTTRNLLSTETDPVGNGAAYSYTNSAYPMSPTAVVKLASGTPVSTNQFFYTNVIQTVTNGAVLATNSAYGLMQRIIRGSAGTNDFLYDGRGFLTQSTRFTGNGDPAVVTTFFYDNRGQLVQKTDALGRSRLYAYDDMGRVTGEEVYESGATTPEGFNYSYYSENGDLVWTDGSRYNPEDYVWRDYDGAGRKITEMRWRSEANTNGGGVQTPVVSSNLYATTFYQYDTFNNLTQVTDPLGNYTVKSYDNIGQLTGEVAYSAAGTPMSTNLYAYEPGGLVKQMTNAIGGVTSKQYTYTGKVMIQTNADGSTNGWRYDLSGRVVTEFQPNGDYWQTTYNDASLNVVRVFHNTVATLATNSVVMDARGNVVKRTDPNNFVFTNVFDGLDRIRIATGPAIVTVANVGINFPLTNFVTNILQQMTTYYYDSSGQTLTTSNALGEKTVATSDALGRPTQVAIYNSNGVSSVRVTSTAYSADHQSVSVTNGTGTNSIVTTTYTDNDGHPLLKIGYPTNGVTEFTWWQYDLAGNCLAQQQCSSNSSGITTWATNGWTYDGLNRVQTETSKDGATTTYGRDALGDVINRAMPGGLTWSATYLNDGRIASEQESGGSLTTRSMTYSYYAAGNPFAGLLKTVVDGRSTTRSNSYDDFLRLASVVSTGSAGPQQTTTTYHYDARSSLTNLAQSFSSNSVGPATSILRVYDGYGHITSESISNAGISLSVMSQGFDAAGRRSQLGGTPFNYQADGMVIAVDGSTFGYANNGLLNGRTNATRKYVVSQRDGRGRVLSTTTTAGLSTLLSETLDWRGDGRLTNYLAVRGDFTDQRYYNYSPLAQRLTQEIFNIGAMQPVTNNYTIDQGATGGLGILTSQTQSGTLSDTWDVPVSAGLDGVSRVIQSQNTLITRPAYGVAKGAGSVSAILDGHPVAVQFDGPDGEGSWRTSLALSPGSHTLSATAFDLSGQHSITTNNSFTANGGATDTVTNAYDGNGNITQRVWVSSLGVTNKIQTLTWDAFDRLINLTDRDANNSGYNFVSVYDGLGRRIRTIQTLVTNGVAITSPADSVSTVDSWYDPQVEFLEAGANVNGTFTSKVYGPDASGGYGGMQGVGGLETLYITGHTTAYGSVQDYFGNILASISNNVVTWTGARYSSYGPVPGYQPSIFSANATLAECLGWHGLRIDPDGDYHVGARRYDPVTGRFMSADPMGHSGSADLYTYCSGDPVNRFDPTGRFGKLVQNDFLDQGGLDPGHQEFLDQFSGQSFTLDQLAGGLAQFAFGVATLPLSIAEGQGSETSILFSGQNDAGQDVSGLRRAWAGFNVVSMFLPVGEIAEAGMALRGGGDALIGAGDAGLIAESEGTFRQAEFGFVGTDLSGRLSTAGNATQLEFNFGSGLPDAVETTATQREFPFVNDLSGKPPFNGHQTEVLPVILPLQRWCQVRRLIVLVLRMVHTFLPQELRSFSDH